MTKSNDIRTSKRISRAGSGGFSIYLPKQWINGWLDEQVAGKEVDMFSLGDQLILTPRLSTKRMSVSAGAMTRDELKEYIVSAFIKGADEFRLESSALSEALIGESRNIVRLLDENLVPASNDDAISYANRPAIVHETNALLSLLFDKVAEGEGLASDLLNSFDINPDKGIQILRLMYSLEEEDIDRVAFQILRNLSKCEPSSRTLTELNLKWTTADALERIGDTLYAVAGLVCESYGLERDELQYPVEYLQEHALTKDFAIPDHIHCLKEQFVADMNECSESLLKVKEAVLARDGKAALEQSHVISCYRLRMEKEFWENASKLTRPFSLREGSAFLLCNRIASRVREILFLTDGLAKRAGLVYYVK